MKPIKIDFPEMREELIECIKGLSDLEYQKKYWGKIHTTNPNVYDDFNQTIHFLYDDSNIAEDPDSWIGLILISQEESSLIKTLNTHIECLFKSYGTKLSDEDYMNKPEWKNIISTSLKLYFALTAT